MHETERAALRTRLARDDNGAIIVFGVFFGVILLGLLYYMIGLGAAIYYRERVQDAADGSAFAAAVVHARGMNTLALINVIMAALLSVLVALRLVQALIIIAQAILYALAWLGGATAAIASALEVVRQAVTRVEDAAKPVILNVNKVLKVGGNVIRVATPIASNLSVLGKVAGHYAPEVVTAVGIPARLTLPVEDDEPPYLCNKAGKIAGTLALLPLAPVIPGSLRKKLAGALGDLIEAGSGWFCDQDTPPPDYEVDEVKDFPATPEMTACASNDKGGEDGQDRCWKAEKEESYGEPDQQTGRCRVTQDVCQHATDDEGWPEEGIPPGLEIPFSEHSWCGSPEAQGLKLDDTDCAEETTNGRTHPSGDTAYGRRLANARENCAPGGEERKEHWWMERELDVTWEWNAVLETWVEVGEVVAVPETAQGRPAERRKPCENVVVGSFDSGMLPVDITVDGKWNRDPNLAVPVCMMEAPRPRAPKPTDPTRVTMRRVEVTQVLGCSGPNKKKKVSVEPLNLSADEYTEGLSGLSSDIDGVGGEYKDVDMKSMGAAADSGGDSSNEDTSPFRFIENHRLGTSDMQIRSLALGSRLGDSDLQDKGPLSADEQRSVHNEAVRVIGVARWGKREEPSGLTKASEVWGRFAVAQAEYYFDLDGPSSVLASWKGWDEKESKDSGRDFLWAMNWTARMRRFRFQWTVDGDSADGKSNNERKKKGSDTMASALGVELDLGKTQDQIASEGPNVPCENIKLLQDLCGQVKELVRSLDGVFIH